MKKIFIAVVAGVFAFCVGSAAQSYTDSRLGIVAGFTSSSSTVKDVDTKSISLYHAGLAFEIPLGGGFAIQPEAIYQVKGMSLSNWGNSTSKDVRNSFETKVGYLEVPVQIQWGPDLLAFVRTDSSSHSSVTRFPPVTRATTTRSTRNSRGWSTD